MRSQTGGNNRLGRYFETQTVRHHRFLSESRLETVGQVYLGVEPEFGFVAFRAYDVELIDGSRMDEP